MAEKTVATTSEQSVAPDRESTRSQERYVQPAVDIYETPDGLVLIADMPGVSKDQLDIRVDNKVLTLQGKATHVAPGEAVYREYELHNFFRQFELSEAVDQAKISAALKHGVMTVHLPKAEQAKPRQIEVTVQ